MEANGLLAEQKRYYCERAHEYDDWWFRRGRYALEPVDAARWFEDCDEVQQALETFRPRGQVLELACGTGLWTRRLARHAEKVTAVEASAEMIALNRQRVADPDVDYVQADVFEWRGRAALGFWLSHVQETLVPGGRVFFVDSGRGDGAHTTELAGCEELRRLADGREFRIVKRYDEPRTVERRLAGLGFDLEARLTANGSLLYATGR